MKSAQFKHNWGQSKQNKTLLVHLSWYHHGELFGETNLPVRTQKLHSSVSVKISIGLPHKGSLGITHRAWPCSPCIPQVYIWLSIVTKHSQIPRIDTDALNRYCFSSWLCSATALSFTSLHVYCHRSLRDVEFLFYFNQKPCCHRKS